MLVDDGLRGGAVVVETRGRHRLFDLADGVFALGDTGLEVVDAGAPGLLGALLAAGVGVGALLSGRATRGAAAAAAGAVPFASAFGPGFALSAFELYFLPLPFAL